MDNRYIVKINSEKFLCFYFENNNICVKEIIDGKISGRKIIAENMRENYTVTLCKSKIIYLFCQSLSGDIIHIKNENDDWNKNVILKSTGKNSANIQFYCIENGAHMSLIYNIPSNSAGNSKNVFDIMKQTFDGKQNWSTPEKIDSIISMDNFLFQVCMITYGYGIMFYRKNNSVSEYNIGCREFNINEIGKYTSVYSTNYRVSCASFLPSENGIHFIFAVKNIFSARIIYRKKSAAGMENYIVLTEMNQVENCEIFIVKNVIYAVWKTPAGIFCSTSDDGGKTFSRPNKYPGKITESLKKASYLSFEKMTEDKFYVNNIYTNCEDICDVKIIPDICDNFINLNKNNKTIPSQTKSNQNKPKENSNIQNMPFKNNNTSYGGAFALQPETNNNKNNIEILNNQINMLNNQLLFKNKQIEQLSASLKRKNEEIQLNEKVWRQKYKKLSEEMQKEIIEKPTDNQTDLCNENCENKTADTDNSLEP